MEFVREAGDEGREVRLACCSDAGVVDIDAADAGSLRDLHERRDVGVAKLRIGEDGVDSVRFALGGGSYGRDDGLTARVQRRGRALDGAVGSRVVVDGV